MRIILIFISLLPFIGFSQGKGDLAHMFSIDYHSYKMEDFNKFLLDTNSQLPYFFDSTQVNNGYRYKYSLSFQPVKIADFGLFVSTQGGETTGAKYVDSIFDPWSGWSGGYEIYSKLKVRSIDIGVSSTLYLSQLFKFDTKLGLLKKMRIGVKGSVAYGFSEFTAYTSSDIRFAFHKSRDFNYSVGMVLGYEFYRKKIFSEVGIDFGYQFKRTNTLTTLNGDNYPYLNENFNVKLDFSGLYGGIYLKIGK
jgi:hypothetical protein